MENKHTWWWILGLGGIGCLIPVGIVLLVVVLAIVLVMGVFFSGGNTSGTNAALLPGAPAVGTPMTIPLLWLSTLANADSTLSNSVGFTLISAESGGGSDALQYWCNNTLTSQACTTGAQGTLGGLLQLGSPGWAGWGLTASTVTQPAKNLAVGLKIFTQVRLHDPWLSTDWNTFQSEIQPSLPSSGATAETFKEILAAYVKGPVMSAWPVTNFGHGCWLAAPNDGKVWVIATAVGPYGTSHRIGWTAPYTTTTTHTKTVITHPKHGKNKGKTVKTTTVTRTVVHHPAVYLSDPTLVLPTSVVATGQGQTIPLHWTGTDPKLARQAPLVSPAQAWVAKLPPPPRHGITHWTLTATWQSQPPTQVSTPLGTATATGTGVVHQQTATVILNAQVAGCIPAAPETAGPWGSSGSGTNVGQSSTLTPSEAVALLSPYLNDINQASKLTGVPAAFIGAEILQESDGNPNVTSPDGAMGLMQLEPGTWITWAQVYNLTNPYNPAQNIIAGSAYLASLYAQWQGWRLTSAAYYSGGGTMRPIVSPGESWTIAGPLLNWGGSPTLETYANDVHANEQTILAGQ